MSWRLYCGTPHIDLPGNHGVGCLEQFSCWKHLKIQIFENLLKSTKEMTRKEKNYHIKSEEK